MRSPTGFAVAFAVAVASCGCSSQKRTGGSVSPAPEARPSPQAVKPTGPAGVSPLASAPRADWPCARTINSVGTRITYDYAGAPASCWFPPDLWLPGCPTRHVQANPDMGLELEVFYRYDGTQRLIGLDSKLRLAAVEAITYEGDKVVFQDMLSYYPVGDTTQIWHLDGSLYGVILGKLLWQELGRRAHPFLEEIGALTSRSRLPRPVRAASMSP